MAQQDEQIENTPRLELRDAISLIVGIVVGAGIYETAPLIFATVESGWVALAVWGVGGVLSLIGAFCYAELASTYPGSGGDYVYLNRAFGRSVGFLFGWAQLSVILTGSIGMMAFIFADYFVRLFGVSHEYSYLYAVLSVIALTAVNLIGLVMGKRTQNFLTAAKVLGLGLIVLAGLAALFLESPARVVDVATGQTNAAGGSAWAGLSLALVFVLYTYGGWNDAAFVASEIKGPSRNAAKALIYGTLAVTAIYLLVNGAYLAGLGIERAGQSSAIAAELLELPFGVIGADIMSALVIISALGAVNGLIFTGSRVFSALGNDHHLFSKLGEWNPKSQVPVWSIVALGLISVALILIVGSPVGQIALSGATAWFGFVLPMWEGRGGFDALLMSTAPVFWFFFLLTGVSLFILRWKDPGTTRPFRVPLYPLTPLIFCGLCLFMLYQSTVYAGALSLLGFLLLLLGLPLYGLSHIKVWQPSS